MSDTVLTSVNVLMSFCCFQDYVLDRFFFIPSWPSVERGSDTNCDDPCPREETRVIKISYKSRRLKSKPINPLRTKHTSRNNDKININTIHHPATRHGSEVQTEFISSRVDPDA